VLLISGFFGKVAGINHHRPDESENKDEHIAKYSQNCQENEERSDVEARREFAGVFVGMRSMLGMLGGSNERCGGCILHDWLNI